MDKNNRCIIFYNEMDGVYEIDFDDTKIEYLITNIMKNRADYIDIEGDHILLANMDEIKERGAESWFDCRKTDEIKRLIREYKVELNSNGLNKSINDFNKFSHYDMDEQTIKINMDNTCIKINLFDPENKIEVIGFSMDHLFLSKLDVTYNPNTTANLWLKTIDEVFSNDKSINLLRHFMAYGLINKFFEWGICLMLYGPRAYNGKSTVIETYGSLFKKTEEIELHKISSRFGREHLKYADFVNADESDVDFKSTGPVKKLIVGNKQLIESKGTKNISDYIDAKVMASCNDLLSMMNKDAGLQRRFEILPTPNSFQNNDDTKRGAKLVTAESKSGIFNWIIEVIPSLIKNVPEFKNGIGERTRRFFELNEMPLSIFVDAYIFMGDGMRIDELIKYYGYFGKEHNCKILSVDEAGHQLAKILMDDNLPKKRRKSNISTKMTTEYTTLELDMNKLQNDFPKAFKQQKKPKKRGFFDTWDKIDDKNDMAPHYDLLEWTHKQLTITKAIKYTDIYDYGVIHFKMKKRDCKKWLQKWVEDGLFMRNKGMVYGV